MISSRLRDAIVVGAFCLIYPVFIFLIALLEIYGKFNLGGYINLLALVVSAFICRYMLYKIQSTPVLISNVFGILSMMGAYNLIIQFGVIIYLKGIENFNFSNTPAYFLISAAHFLLLACVFVPMPLVGAFFKRIGPK